MCFELYGREHPERRVTALTVMEDLEVFEDRVRQLASGAPSLAVEEFDLHPTPERLDDRIVVAVADGAHRRDESGFERPGSELTVGGPRPGRKTDCQPVSVVSWMRGRACVYRLSHVREVGRLSRSTRPAGRVVFTGTSMCGRGVGSR